ncbi:MAG: ribose 5-phosphate isomerase A [Anaerolineae bacterium]|nr:ribose 5-phosphate isomerase A [Anaerolineae bacterium]
MSAGQRLAPEVSLKQQAADRVLTYIESGMIVGLGHGSTAILAVRSLGAKIASGELTDIVGIPCSSVIEVEAKQLGIPLTTLDDHAPGASGQVIDLTFDGADEVDPALNLIKGGGGALLREKIIAQASRREIITVDESKLSPSLGTHWTGDRGDCRRSRGDPAFEVIANYPCVRKEDSLDVSAPVITLALQQRFESRAVEPFSLKLLAAMRQQFGGHAVKTS